MSNVLTLTTYGPLAVQTITASGVTSTGAFTNIGVVTLTGPHTFTG